MPNILAFSGSPVENSNTDRLLKNILEHVNYPYEFIKLSDYLVRPCTGCKQCVETGKCTQEDDYLLIEEKIRNADAIIYGAYTPFSSLDAYTKALLERLFALHHQIQLRDKFVISVVSSLTDSVALSAHTTIALSAIMEQMRHVGMLSIAGSPPCATCGEGEACPNTLLYKFYGEDAVSGAHNCSKVEKLDCWKESVILAKKLNYLLAGEELFKPSKFISDLVYSLQ